MTSSYAVNHTVFRRVNSEGTQHIVFRRKQPADVTGTIRRGMRFAPLIFPSEALDAAWDQIATRRPIVAGQVNALLFSLRIFVLAFFQLGNTRAIVWSQ